MSGTLEVDESAFPLVVTTFRGRVTADLIATYLVRVDAWCKSQHQYAAVLDISRTDVPSAAERKHVAGAVAARDDANARYCVGTAVVLTSALLRGAVTAVLWLSPMKHPLTIVATRAEGRAWCAERLSALPSSRGTPSGSAVDVRDPV